jgi:hypothetical protein
MPTRKEEETLQEAIKKAFQKTISSGRQIAAQAVTSCLGNHATDRAWIKRNFSRLVEEVQVRAYEAYLVEERNAGELAIVTAFLPILPSQAKPEDAVRLVASYFFALDRFFLSLTQGRRPRAGSAFEFLLSELFKRLQYPFTEQPVIDGQADFVMPSVAYFKQNAPDAVIFTAKRTLRERWTQITTEGTRGLGFFLATIDEHVSQADLRRMIAHRITVVVPDRIRRQVYPKEHNVITFEQFFRDHLDPAMKRWRNRGIV